MYFNVSLHLCMFRKHTNFRVQLPGCMRDDEISFENAILGLNI